MDDFYLDTIDSPAGPLHVAVNGSGAVVGVWFGVTTAPEFVEKLMSGLGTVTWSPTSCSHVATQISEYDRRVRTGFELELRFQGTDWEMQVWKALLTIPYGETRSYGQIATQLGDPSKARAVGWANHVNPIPLLIPCHRVIGAQRNLTGFGGGIDAKIQLLAHEGAMLPGFA